MASAAEQTETPSTKAVLRLSDVVPALRERLPPGTASREGFDRYVASLDRETEARERAGEYEHLIYFLLQSQVFTSEPRIEPALSAYELLHGLDLADAAPRITTPPAVARRVSDFVHGLGVRTRRSAKPSSLRSTRSGATAPTRRSRPTSPCTRRSR